ncbi:hypothetical protein ACVGOW_13060 [Pseudonocardia saturnea]
MSNTVGQPNGSSAPPHLRQSVSHSHVGRDVNQIGYAGNVHIGLPAFWLVVAVIAVATLTVAAVLVIVLPAEKQASPTQPGAPMSAPAQVVDPQADITEHDIWASSEANVWVGIEPGQWAMTSFRVDLPYIRSIEVAAAPNALPGAADSERVLLRVLDDHGNEIDQGEALISEFRAKVVFSHSVDVQAYLGRHLYLQMQNLTDEPVRAYFTPDDRDRSVTSYLPCGAEIPTLCPNAVAQDLSALVISRRNPW